MCRKNYLHGCCLICAGLGLILGHCLEGWMLCCGGGIVLVTLGLLTVKKR